MQPLNDFKPNSVVFILGIILFQIHCSGLEIYKIFRMTRCSVVNSVTFTLGCHTFRVAENKVNQSSLMETNQLSSKVYYNNQHIIRGVAFLTKCTCWYPTASIFIQWVVVGKYAHYFSAFQNGLGCSPVPKKDQPKLHTPFSLSCAEPSIDLGRSVTMIGCSCHIVHLSCE